MSNKPKGEDDVPVIIIIDEAKAKLKKFAAEKPGIAAVVLVIVGFILGRLSS